MNRKMIAIVLILAVTLPLLYIAVNHLNKRIQRTRAATNLRALAKAGTLYSGSDDTEYTVCGSPADANASQDFALPSEPYDF